MYSAGVHYLVCSPAGYEWILKSALRSTVATAGRDNDDDDGDDDAADENFAQWQPRDTEHLSRVAVAWVGPLLPWAFFCYNC